MRFVKDSVSMVRSVVGLMECGSMTGLKLCEVDIVGMEQVA